jgi:phosphatidylserine/phosphatidylglycerophosphate/cardiolipin synthase-like enzyme
MRKISLVIAILLTLPVISGYEEYHVQDITVFVSPDSSYHTLTNFIDNAQASLYINIYTFNNPYIAEHIINASERGIDVVLLIEASPVGGFKENQEQILNKIASSSVKVYYSRDRRFRFLHAKYAIADNRSILITTENFDYTGIPVDSSFGNRGWGAIIDDSEFTSYYLKVFFDDLRYGEAINWSGNFSPIDYPIPRGKYNPRFESREHQGNFLVVPVIAPENAVARITELLKSANESVYIEQAYIYKYWGSRKEGSVETTPNLFLEEAIDAARRGCEVKILLDSTWYNVEREDPVSNYYTAEYVNEIARREKLNLEARLADFQKTKLLKMHTKGVIIDKKVVFILKSLPEY